MKRKKLILEISYEDKMSLDAVLIELKNRVLLMGEIKCNRNEAICIGRLTHDIPLNEPKIEEINGVPCLIYKSSI